MDFKLAQLQAAATDLNGVLKLEPPIVVEVEIKGRGAAKAKAEADFMAQLKKDILEVAEGQDPDTKVFDLRPDDLSALKPETIEVIYGLSEVTKARLTVPVTAGKGKVPVTAGKGKAEKKISARTVIFNCVKEGNLTAEQAYKKLEGKVESKLIKMYLRAWEKGDRCPEGEKMTYSKEGIIKFKK